MNNPYTVDAATLLIQTLFGLYILIVLLRFLLQWIRADFYNPISQFIVKATHAPDNSRLRRPRPGGACPHAGASMHRTMADFQD
jgi:YggT family protein